MIYYNRLRIFNCKIYNPKSKNIKIKLDHKSKNYCFIGFANSVKKYMPWDPSVC